MFKPSRSGYALVLTLLILATSFQYSFCQQAGLTISGKVIIENSELPVASANVYINGTTIGTSTDSLGRFTLRVTVFPVQVIVSHVSYQSLSYTAEKPVINLVFKVQPRVEILPDVVIGKKDTWKWEFQRFRDNFLGTDYWGVHAKILNDSVLNFYDDKYFEAFASAPVLVDQPRLGYQISVDLIHFTRSYNMSLKALEVTNLGNYYFIPSADYNSKAHKEARLNAYYNSQQHFLRALYNNKLDEEGYKIYEKQYDSLTKKVFVRYVDINQFCHREGDAMVVRGLLGKSFVVFYYFDENGKPKKLKESKLLKFKQSEIFFQDDACTIQSNGSQSSSLIILGGELGAKKVGAMLPENYTPGD